MQKLHWPPACLLPAAQVLIAAVPCLATYWVTQYWQLFILRTLTGVSVGGCFPLIYSLLGDLVGAGRQCGN